MYGKGRELEIGNATSAIVISLLRTLVDKGVLSNSEARAVLTRAAAALGRDNNAKLLVREHFLS
jgi:hypothetical protein